MLKRFLLVILSTILYTITVLLIAVYLFIGFIPNIIYLGGKYVVTGKEIEPEECFDVIDTIMGLPDRFIDYFKLWT